MDKSGRKALASNLAAITEKSGSRRKWTLAKSLDTKTVERAEKDEGEKGVSLQAVDEIAHGLKLAAWQLLVPGLDLDNPPRLSTEPQQEAVADLAAALEVVRARLADTRGEERARAAAALELLAKAPDSGQVFQQAIEALSARSDSGSAGEIKFEAQGVGKSSVYSRALLEHVAKKNTVPRELALLMQFLDRADAAAREPRIGAAKPDMDVKSTER